MTTPLQIRLACIKIVRGKKEKNQALANEQRPPKHQLISTFDELEKEIVGVGARTDETLRELESVVISMVKDGKLIPSGRGFCLPETMTESRTTAEKHWKSITTKPIRE